MIKDNHIKYAGSLTKAVEKLRQHISHAHKIEVECDTFEQVKEAVACNVEKKKKIETCIIEENYDEEADKILMLEYIQDAAAICNRASGSTYNIKKKQQAKEASNLPEINLDFLISNV